MRRARNSRNWWWVAVGALLAAILAAIVRLAWLSDDAYVTLRTVENLLAGHGPVWNVGERVQTHAHPAWFLLLAAGRWLSGEHYYTTIALSVLASMAAAFALARLARTPPAALAVLCALLGSRAFGDFATSGLDTPLAMLLLVMLAQADANTPAGGSRLTAITTLVAACGLTRPDLLVVAGPVLFGHVRREHGWRQGLAGLAAMSPLIAWLLFAAFYYGSPFPIVAYAKALSPGLPAAALMQQGWHYLEYSWRHDPLTLLVIGAGITCGLANRRLQARCCAVGVVLACVYVIRVGGDFMGGRFFVPPFALAVAILARALADAPSPASALAAVASLALPWCTDTPAFLRPPAADLPVPEEHGVTDERRFWYACTGLYAPHRLHLEPGCLTAALRRQGRQRPIVMSVPMAGQAPFAAGELFHFVDVALCDPLLMRLPMLHTTQWRIGHFFRGFPDGYLASLASGGDKIAHEGLRDYYRGLRSVLRDELTSGERWAALLSLWGGTHDQQRASYVADEYEQPPRRDVPIADLESPRAPGSFWFDDPGIRLLGRGGLHMTCAAPRTAAAMQVGLLPMVGYRFVFRRDGAEVGRAELMANVDAGQPPMSEDADVLGFLQKALGLQPFVVSMPPQLPPFDAIDVDAELMPWTIAGIGSIELRN